MNEWLYQSVIHLSACLNKQVSKWMKEWMNQWLSSWINEWVNERCSTDLMRTFHTDRRAELQDGSVLILDSAPTPGLWSLISLGVPSCQSPMFNIPSRPLINTLSVLSGETPALIPLTALKIGSGQTGPAELWGPGPTRSEPRLLLQASADPCWEGPPPHTLRRGPLHLINTL